MSTKKIEIKTIQTLHYIGEKESHCISFNWAYPDEEGCFPMVDSKTADNLVKYLLRCNITNPSGVYKKKATREVHLDQKNH